jgi:hypothetical protein
VLLGVEATHTRPDVAPMIFHGSKFRQLSGTGPAH